MTISPPPGIQLFQKLEQLLACNMKIIFHIEQLKRSIALHSSTVCEAASSLSLLTGLTLHGKPITLSRVMPELHWPQARAAAMAQVSTIVHFGLFFIKIKTPNLSVAGLAPACQETATDSASVCPAPRQGWQQKEPNPNEGRESKL